MKRTSPIYVKYLEALVLSLLAERASDDDIVGTDFTGAPVTYSPYNIQELIGKVEN
jgi:hypothetical protein